MSEVANGGLPAENPSSPPQEESIIPDTPLRSEGNHETSALEVEQEQNVTTSRKEYARLINLMSASPEARATEITPNVSPLDSEPKEHDMQEKKAALKGEEAPMIAEIVESQKALLAIVNQLRKERTPVRTALFPETTLKYSGQLKSHLTCFYLF